MDKSSCLHESYLLLDSNHSVMGSCPVLESVSAVKDALVGERKGSGDRGLERACLPDNCSAGERASWAMFEGRYLRQGSRRPCGQSTAKVSTAQHGAVWQ